MIQVLVVAASPIVRAGLLTMLTSNPELMLVGSISNIDSLGEEIQQLQPDVVLVDLGGNSESNWGKLLQLLEQQYLSAILVLTDELSAVSLGMVLRAGIRGILLDTSSEAEIIAAVEAIASGLVVLQPDAVENLLTKEASSIQPKATIPSQDSLTAREIEVLEMLGSGMGNKAIAKHLHISEHTVKFHLSSIFQKLGVATRTEAVSVGVRLGLILL